MYAWLVALHLVGLVVFLVSHAVSMWVAFRVRGETSRDVVAALLGMSARGSQVMYLGLLLLGVGGLGAAATAGWLTAPWAVASYAVIVLVIVLMYVCRGTVLLRPARRARGDRQGGAARRFRARRPPPLGGQSSSPRSAGPGCSP